MHGAQRNTRGSSTLRLSAFTAPLLLSTCASSSLLSFKVISNPYLIHLIRLHSHSVILFRYISMFSVCVVCVCAVCQVCFRAERPGNWPIIIRFGHSSGHPQLPRTSVFLPDDLIFLIFGISSKNRSPLGLEAPFSVRRLRSCGNAAHSTEQIHKFRWPWPCRMSSTRSESGTGSPKHFIAGIIFLRLRRAGGHEAS